MFRCNECSVLIEGESEFWNHLSTHHFKYLPYRCNYCKGAGELHFTATEDKMKKHTEAIHCVKDLHMSIRKKHNIETQFQVTLESCHIKSAKSPSGFRDALRLMTADSPTGIKRAFCQTNFLNDTAEPLPQIKVKSFSSALIVSAFRLIIIFYEDGTEPHKEFRIENLVTNEVLQLKNITEEDAINYCGEYTPKTNAKYIIVERSRL